MQPRDSVVALDLLLALGAFALSRKKTLSVNHTYSTLYVRTDYVDTFPTHQQ